MHLTLIGYRKSKSTWVVKMASKSRRRTMVSWHLVEAGYASTWMMKMASVKSRRKVKVSSLTEVRYTSRSVSHAS